MAFKPLVVCVIFRNRFPFQNPISFRLICYPYFHKFLVCLCYQVIPQNIFCAIPIHLSCYSTAIIHYRISHKYFHTNNSNQDNADRKNVEVASSPQVYIQKRVQPDQCYFSVQITGSNFECSL